jgi:hypothetical protein
MEHKVTWRRTEGFKSKKWIKGEKTGQEKNLVEARYFVAVQVEARYFVAVQNGPEAYPASCKMGTWSFLGVNRQGFKSPFWCIQFEGGPYIFGKFVDPWSTLSFNNIYVKNCYLKSMSKYSWRWYITHRINVCLYCLLSEVAWFRWSED